MKFEDSSRIFKDLVNSKQLGLLLTSLSACIIFHGPFTCQRHFSQRFFIMSPSPCLFFMVFRPKPCKEKEPVKLMGYSRKYPHTPPWTTLNWVPKNFRISKKDNCSFCRIPEPADSKPWGIPEFRKNLEGFPGMLVKIYKILGKFVDFQSYTPSISYRISIVVDGVCVDIFWNSPMQWVKIAHSFLPSVSNLFHSIVLSLPM